MAKMQGAEDEGAGSVLKYMTKPNPIATKQIGYYDTPPFFDLGKATTICRSIRVQQNGMFNESS